MQLDHEVVHQVRRQAEEERKENRKGQKALSVTQDYSAAASAPAIVVATMKEDGKLTRLEDTGRLLQFDRTSSCIVSTIT